MKKIVLLLAICLALTTQTLFAQVPSYVPTTGLVGYWPFNGNANDESGNGNNGIVNGNVIITNDRNNIANSAFEWPNTNSGFGSSSFISLPNLTSQFQNGEFSISLWVNKYPNPISIDPRILGIGESGLIFNGNSSSIKVFLGIGLGTFTNPIGDNQWAHIVFVNNGISGQSYFYLNGILIHQITTTPSQNIVSSSSDAWELGRKSISAFNGFGGKIDDVGIWNRALTSQEITNLYNSANSNECLTMVINTGVLSTNPVTYTSTVNIYPNPANDQITIDCGNLANVVGWSIKITNMLGQEVFNQPMNTQQYVVPLNSWTGQGMYFVKISNAQNEVVNIKKIILQ
jgi:hypothetical protein